MEVLVTFLVGAGTGVVGSLAGVYVAHVLGSRNAQRDRLRQANIEALDATIAYLNAEADVLWLRILGGSEREELVKDAEKRKDSADPLRRRDSSLIPDQEAVGMLDQVGWDVLFSGLPDPPERGNMGMRVHNARERIVRSARLKRLELLK